MLDYNNREFVAWEAQQRKIAEEARNRADAEELRMIMPRVERGDVGAFVDLVAHWARVHRVTVDYVRGGIVPFSVRATRTVAIPFPTTDRDLAVIAHEISHLLIPPCAGPPRHAQFIEDRTTSCLECETLTTEHALRLWPTMSRAGFERLREGLQSYRASTPAAPSVLAAADRVLSGVTYAEAQERHHALAWRRALQQRVEAQVAATTRADQQRWGRMYE